MKLPRTRLVAGAVAFALLSAAAIDSASAQLFFRRALRNSCCCAPVTACCGSGGHYGYSSYRPVYGSSWSNGYGMTSGYVSSGIGRACCGSASMGTQVQSHSGNGMNTASTFAAPGSTYTGQPGQDPYHTYKPAMPGADAQGRTDADRQQNSAEFRGDLQVNPDGTVRGNSDLDLNRANQNNQNNQNRNPDGSLRTNSELNQNRDGTLPGRTDLNVDGSIRGNTDLDRRGTAQGQGDLNLDGTVRRNEVPEIERK